MKKFLFFLLISINSLVIWAQTPFVSGNLLVLKSGNGTNSTTTSMPVSVVEYDKTGLKKQTINIPSSGASRFVLANNSTTIIEGFLNLSYDNDYVTFAGYDTIPGRTGLQNSNGIVANGGILRSVGKLDALGNFSVIKTALPGGTGTGVTAVIQADNGRAWVASRYNFLQYVNTGTSTNSRTWGTTSYDIKNNSDIGIFNNQIYFSSASTLENVSGLYALTTSNKNFPITTSANPVKLALPNLGLTPNGFMFFDTNEDGKPDLLYIADETASIGLQKYYFDGTNWLAKGTVQVPAAASNKNLRDITGVFENGVYILYGNTGSSILSFTDSALPDADISASTQILATAETNYVFRGISFTPGTKKPDPRPESYALRIKANSDFIGTINSNVTYRKHPGLEETHLTYTDLDGKPMAFYFFTVDLSNPNIRLEAEMPNGGTAFRTQTVRNQIPYKNNVNTDFKVIGAVNADFWDTSTLGTPLGLVYMNGTTLKDLTSDYYFLSVQKDNTAIIGDINDYNKIKSNIKYALGGRIYATRQYDAYVSNRFVAKEPRLAVGLLNPNKVIFLAVDGRRPEHSNGVTPDDFGLLYRALGAESSILLDGGGSLTMVTKQQDNTYKVINKISNTNEAERAVANSWMILGRTEPITTPVRLKSFTGSKHGNYVKLNWTTSSEKDNSHFEIFRSKNKEFQLPIGTVPGGGDSQNLLTYNYTDINPFTGVNYYQLNQVDYNGKSEKSNIIAVNTGFEQETLSLQKNGEELRLVMVAANKGDASIRISDISGKVLSASDVKLAKGENYIPIVMPNANGAYIITLYAEGKNRSIKFVK